MTFKYDDPVAKTLSQATIKAISAKIKEDIDAFCVKEFTDDHREHLGASLIGHDCHRFIWYAFRWVKSQVFNGRMLRLFNRGHLEEERFIKWLRGIGCQVWEVDPNTNQQFRIYGVQGHYGGSMDSGGLLPYLPDLPILFEFKTHNTKSFTNLVNKGSVKLAKHEHYSQMSAYGKKYKMRYGLYVATNKNDDDLYIELVELDWNLAHDLENKAQDIIRSPFPPPRISDQPSYYECKWCAFHGICHYNEPVEINCRSCKFAEPVENKQWKCHKFNAIVPTDYIKQGCSHHVSIAT